MPATMAYIPPLSKRKRLSGISALFLLLRVNTAQGRSSFEKPESIHLIGSFLKVVGCPVKLHIPFSCWRSAYMGNFFALKVA